MSKADFLILAAVELPPPAVTVLLTPSFPAQPGDSVLVNAIADNLADIVNLDDAFSRWCDKEEAHAPLMVDGITLIPMLLYLQQSHDNQDPFLPFHEYR